MNYLYICNYYVIILPFKGAVISNKVFVFDITEYCSQDGCAIVV